MPGTVTPTQCGTQPGLGRGLTPRFTSMKYYFKKQCRKSIGYYLSMAIVSHCCVCTVQAILVTGVVVDQYSWSRGFAANLGLMLNSSSEWIELRGEMQMQMQIANASTN